MSRLGPAASRVVKVAVATARVAVKAAATLALALHLLLTTVYVLPDNPVKAQLLPLLNATIDVYARQTWNLFAPNPISTDFILLARCLDSSIDSGDVEALLATDESSGWADLSQPLWQGFQSQRFAAYDRLARPFTATVRTYINGGTGLNRWRSACLDKGDKPACEIYDQGVVRARAASEPKLRRLGSAVCNQIAPGSRAVALRARVENPVPWSRRFDRAYTPETNDVSLGIHPILPSVRGIAIFYPEGQ